MPKHSKLQKQVLSLYKQYLKVCADRPGLKQHIQSEFKKNANIPKTDILRVDHVMRRAVRQLEQLKKPSVQGISAFQKSIEK